MFPSKIPVFCKYRSALRISFQFHFLSAVGAPIVHWLTASQNSSVHTHSLPHQSFICLASHPQSLLPQLSLPNRCGSILCHPTCLTSLWRTQIKFFLQVFPFCLIRVVLQLLPHPCNFRGRSATQELPQFYSLKICPLCTFGAWSERVLTETPCVNLYRVRWNMGSQQFSSAPKDQLIKDFKVWSIYHLQTRCAF